MENPYFYVLHFLPNPGPSGNVRDGPGASIRMNMVNEILMILPSFGLEILNTTTVYHLFVAAVLSGAAT